LLMSMLTP